MVHGSMQSTATSALDRSRADIGYIWTSTPILGLLVCFTQLCTFQVTGSCVKYKRYVLRIILYVERLSHGHADITLYSRYNN